MATSVSSKVWDMLKLPYLITESNIKAYVQPVTLFAMLSTASGRFTSDPRPTWMDMTIAFPHVLLYVWLYVLQFDLSNQKDPESIEEDKINKPWRVIPSGKLTVEGAERGHVVAVFLLLAVPGFWLGGFPEAVAFLVLTWIHDNASFGASTWWGKNIINALFYVAGQLGSTRVAARAMGSAPVLKTAYGWCILLAFNTLTTVQIQDLRDQEGDRARGRSTMPLAFGDTATRLMTAALVCFWSVISPAYWASDHITAAYVLPVLLGAFVSSRVISCTSIKEDRRTYHFYTLFWLPSLYFIPLLSQYDLASVGYNSSTI